MKEQIPQHLIDAAKHNKYIDPKDPWVRKMMREERKKEKERKKRDEEYITKQWEESQSHRLTLEYEEFLKIEEDNKNTVEWNYFMKCKWCESESMRIIIRPHILHFAEYRCNVCHKYNEWLPYPKHNGEL